MEKEEELIEGFKFKLLKKIKQRSICMFTKSNQPTLGFPQVDLERFVFHVILPETKGLIKEIKSLSTFSEKEKGT